MFYLWQHGNTISKEEFKKYAEDMKTFFRGLEARLAANEARLIATDADRDRFREECTRLRCELAAAAAREQAQKDIQQSGAAEDSMGNKQKLGAASTGSVTK